MKRALICGISGQDGGYLASILLDKGYEVFGSSRDAQVSSFKNLTTLGIRDRVKVLSATLTDFRSVLQALVKVEPDEVYNLAGQSSVGLSFDQPVETLESISIGTLNLLEVIRFLGSSVRVYNASSGECFGDTGNKQADETFPFRPRSPYAVAKAAAHWQVANYRDAYGLFACSGILFNHESPLRPNRFVTRKIAGAVARISMGSQETLKLGNLRVARDWGWAPEYVDAMWRMLQHDYADDYVIATGVTTSLERFVALAFAYVGLDWHDHVEFDNGLIRPNDIPVSGGSPAKAQSQLAWTPRTMVNKVVELMVSAELRALSPDRPKEDG